MSGFVGIFNLDGSPVDDQLLKKMTKALAIRGPDNLENWYDGPAGLGHALLQITIGGAQEKQPAQLDRHLWITADARIDARDELIKKLRAKSQAADALAWTQVGLKRTRRKNVIRCKVL